MTRLRRVAFAGAMTSGLLVVGCFERAPACLEGECSAGTEGEPDDASSSATSHADSGGSDDSTTIDGASGRGLPCDVQDVVDRHCTGCHDESPIYGAPMSLFDVTAWRVPAHGDPTLTVAQMAAMRIVDEVDPMPASGPLPAGDLAVLQTWIDAGTPSGSCEGDSGSGTDTGSDTDPDDPTDPGALPCEPTLELTAHDGDEPFHVPAEGADNLYQCFTFASPVGAQSQAIAWAPIVDDERVLHHWILFRTSAALADGGAGPCNLPEDATIVAGWAPGGGVYEFPDDVGLDLGGADGSFILQMHYNNSANHADVFDRSGVAMCVVDEPREHTAAFLTLGTKSFAIPADVTLHQAEGMCPSERTSLMPEPLHVLSSFPHMHERGVAMRTDILRGGEDGPEELLVDLPNFDFDNQTSIPIEPEILIEPGDAVRTTCTWGNDGGEATQYGLDSEDEMCFNFVMVWPIDAYGGNHECILSP